MDLIDELHWRGMIHDIMPGTAGQLKKEPTTVYVGFDPSSDSLHIGNLVSIILLKHMQKAGHKPIALVGGATGMIGDPSGKSKERNLLDEEVIRKNADSIRKQLSGFLDFSVSGPARAEMVNNLDWMKEFTFLDFVRDVGKYITVNYMMSKDSVRKRLGKDSVSGMSFTEFSYQLLQGYDFMHLYQTRNCKLQMGGSDQWGNIVTGTELIRRILSGNAYALTCPLITRSGGGKFGKTEEGNVWLDPAKTSVYKFYQFWLNVTDADAEKYIRIFTLLGIDEIKELINRHRRAPEERLLQKSLAREVTVMVHSEEDFRMVADASGILFGKATKETLQNIREDVFLSVFEGVPLYSVEKNKLGEQLIELLTAQTRIFSSRGEYRRMVQNGGVFLNKERVTDPDHKISSGDLINGKYMIIQKGKKNHHLIQVKS